MTSQMVGRDTDSGLRDYAQEKGRELLGLVPGVVAGAVANTQTFLVMAHDDSKGRIELVDGRVRIAWPDCGKQAIFERIDRELLRATAALGGTYLKNPMWTEARPWSPCIRSADAAWATSRKPASWITRGASSPAAAAPRFTRACTSPTARSCHARSA
jgi:hypothetical protein